MDVRIMSVWRVQHKFLV